MSPENERLLLYCLGVGGSMITISLGIFAAALPAVRETQIGRGRISLASTLGVLYIFASIVVTSVSIRELTDFIGFPVGVVWAFGPFFFWWLILWALWDLSKTPPS